MSGCRLGKALYARARLYHGLRGELVQVASQPAPRAIEVGKIRLLIGWTGLGESVFCVIGCSVGPRHDERSPI